MHLVVERPRRGGVVAERLLHDNTRVLRQACFGQSLDHHAEERRGDLEVEDGALLVADRAREPFVGARVGEISGQERQTLREAFEHGLIDRLAARFDRAARALAQILDRPVVTGDSHDRAVEQPAALESIQRVERHHLGEVAGDAEHDERIGMACRASPARGCWRLGCERCAHSSLSFRQQVPRRTIRRYSAVGARPASPECDDLRWRRRARHRRPARSAAISSRLRPRSRAAALRRSD